MFAAMPGLKAEGGLAAITDTRLISDNNATVTLLRRSAASTVW
jgi:hypothetical protein